MWDRRKLEQLAIAEAQLFADPRFERLHLAMTRHRGQTHEALAPEAETRVELEAALQTISPSDILAQPVSLATTALLTDILALKQSHPALSQVTPAPTSLTKTAPKPDAEPEDDTEPTM
jgi:hypothetical protein